MLVIFLPFKYMHNICVDIILYVWEPICANQNYDVVMHRHLCDCGWTPGHPLVVYKYGCRYEEMYRQLCNFDLSIFVVVVVVYRHLCNGTPGHPLVVIRTRRDYIMLPSPPPPQ